MLTRLSNRRGFSLIELAVVLIIIAVIAAIAIPTFNAVIDASQDNADEASATAIGRNALALTAATAGSTYAGGTTDADVATAAGEAGASATNEAGDVWEIDLGARNACLTVTGQAVSAVAGNCP